MSISNFTISPDTQNRQSNTACGLQNISSGLNFNVSCLTSGDPNTCGFAIQGGQNGGLLTGPLDTMRLWIDDLATTSAFNIRPTLDLNLSPISTIINVNDTILMDKASTIERKTTISAGSIEVRDTINDPVFGDPIFTEITPNLIQFRNGNSNNQTASMNVSSINLTNSDSGFINDIAVDNITIQDTVGSQIGTMTNTLFSIYDNVLNFSNVIDASSITSTNWSIDTLGQGLFSSLYISSWTTTTNQVIGGGGILTLNFNSQQNKTFRVSMNQNITSLVLNNHITNSVYKVYLNVQASGPYTFSKPTGGNIYTNLLGLTSMAANSVWLINITDTGTNIICDFFNYTN